MLGFMLSLLFCDCKKSKGNQHHHKQHMGHQRRDNHCWGSCSYFLGIGGDFEIAFAIVQGKVNRFRIRRIIVSSNGRIISITISSIGVISVGVISVGGNCFGVGGNFTILIAISQ